VKTSQQLKLSNFVKRKGDNNNSVTDASKQSKSSFINDVEIVHARLVTVRVKPKVSVAVEKKCQKTVSGFMAFRFCLAHV
jgi:hypothetical protein